MSYKDHLAANIIFIKHRIFTLHTKSNSYTTPIHPISALNMKFQIFTAALYASLALASAIPQPAARGASALEARGVDIDNEPDEDWVCPGKDGKTVTYKKKEIKAAIEKGVELAKDGKQVQNGNDNPFPCKPQFYLHLSWSY